MSARCLVPRLLNSKVGCDGFKKYWVSILGLSGVAPEFQNGGRWGVTVLLEGLKPRGFSRSSGSIWHSLFLFIYYFFPFIFY